MRLASEARPLRLGLAPVPVALLAALTLIAAACGGGGDNGTDAPPATPGDGQQAPSSTLVRVYSSPT